MNPNEDGVTHINIYSKGRTTLGRFLSNFAKANILLPADGQFASIEGYWYWLTRRDNQLRNLYGFRAKQIGKPLPKVCEESDFQKKVANACWYKLHSNPTMLAEFRDSTLPFEHYYVYNGKSVNAGHRWLLDMWECYRQYIKNDYV